MVPAVANTPMWRDWVSAQTASTVGRITPNTRREGSIRSKSHC